MKRSDIFFKNLTYVTLRHNFKYAFFEESGLTKIHEYKKEGAVPVREEGKNEHKVTTKMRLKKTE